MDRDFGSKPGSGGAMSSQNEQVERRERLRKLALETVDLSKDPYFMKNHLWTYECKLCLTEGDSEYARTAQLMRADKKFLPDRW